MNFIQISYDIKHETINSQIFQHKPSLLYQLETNIIVQLILFLSNNTFDIMESTKNIKVLGRNIDGFDSNL